MSEWSPSSADEDKLRATGKSRAQLQAQAMADIASADSVDDTQSDVILARQIEEGEQRAIDLNIPDRPAGAVASSERIAEAPQTAMAVAMAKAGGAEAVKVSEVKSAEPSSAAIEKPTAPKRSFNPVSYIEGARKSYIKIGKELREQGVAVEEIPEEVFVPANTAMDKLYSLAEEYKQEPDATKKKDIAKQMREIKSALESTIVSGIEEKVQDLETTKEIRAHLEKPAEAAQNIPAAPTVPEVGPATPGPESEHPDPDEVPTIQIRPEDVPEYMQEALKKEGTPLEHRGRFFETMSRAKEMFGHSGEALQKYLSGRNEDLDLRAKQLGPRGEGFVTEYLKKYNALNWKKKAAVSVALMSATMAGTLMMPASLVSMVLLPTIVAGQRAIGMAGFMIARRAAIEGKIQADPRHGLANAGEFRKTLNAAGQATLYFSLLGGATTALMYGGESLFNMQGPAHTVVENAKNSWLGKIFGHETAAASAAHVEAPAQAHPAAAPAPHEAGAAAPVKAPEVAPVPVAQEIKIPEASHSTIAPEVKAPETVSSQPVAEAVTGDPTTAGISPEIKIPTIEASSRGYEGTLKDLWKSLQEKHITLPANAPDSDLKQLLNAHDQKSLDRIVHKIAIRHGFFHELTGKSVLIDAHSRLTVDPESGQIELLTFTAPSRAPITAALYPDASGASSIPSVEAIHSAGIPPVEVPAPIEPSNLPPPTTHAEVPATTEVPKPPVETIPASSEKLPIVNLAGEKSPEIPTIDLTHGQDLAAQKLAEAASTQVAAEHAQGLVNAFGIEVSNIEPHIYADKGAEHLFVFGGSPIERAKAILNYLTANPDKTVYGADNNGNYRIPWGLVEGKLVPGAPAQTSGFLGFLKSFMEAAKPDEFEKIIQ